MSFSMQVKGEVARLPIEHQCCQQAELAALARVLGVVRLGKQKILVMETEAAVVARRIFLLSKNLGWKSLITINRYSRPRRRRLFTVQIPLMQQQHNLLQDLGFVDRKQHLMDTLDPNILEKNCCRKAFLRGCFLGSGFVGNPKNAYHLELFFKTPAGANEAIRALTSFGVNPNTRKHRDGYELYLKEADQVVEFLRIIGANQAVLQVENCRVIKDMRNQVNRLVNCETANLEKSVEAGLKQVAVIEEIQSLAGLGVLPPALRELAELRLLHPEASLSDLGKLLTPSLSKSGVYHRFREISRIADQLRKKQSMVKRDGTPNN
ncbi:MAG: DNA-binding protein WhiA [Thermacetogeniaceae bacterium]|jgi:DNA-binding protein WhiA